MKKLFLNLITLVTIISCENGKENLCKNEAESSRIEISRENIYYFHRHNYSKVVEYTIFKKYGLIDYMEYYPFTTDSCFEITMNEKIEKSVKKLNLLNVETTKYKKDEEIRNLKYNRDNIKYLDSIYSPIGNIGYPVMIYPMNERNFKESLIKQIKEIDTSYESSSFWIVINDKGKVEKIERYKKHSLKTDDLIKERLVHSKWIPSLNKKDSTFVRSRIIFRISK